MKLFKPFTPHAIAWFVRKVFHQLQCLASAMPKPVVPSGYQELWKGRSF